jgi:hypothetical protein
MIVVEDWYVSVKIGVLMNDSSQPSRGTHRTLIGGWSVACQSGAPVVLALGIIGQLVDSRTYPSHAASAELHALFGLGVCAAVFTHFYEGMKHAPRATSEEIARFARAITRKIYLLLYVLLGLRIAMGLDRPQPQAAEGFRDYLIGGVLALVLIRVLAARWSRVAAFTPIESRQPSAESL